MKHPERMVAVDRTIRVFMLIAYKSFKLIAVGTYRN